MFAVSNEIKSLLQENYRQIIKIQFPNGEDIIELTEADLVQNSFQWDRYCATGDTLEIGAATAAEVAFTLRNDTRIFYTTAGTEVSVDDIDFEGKELTIQIGISKWGARRWENARVLWFPIGKFTIMSMPHKFSTIKISALDRMTWFDLYVPREDGNPFASVETLHSIIGKICGVVGISYIFPPTLPNYDLTVDIDTLFEESPELTYRMLIQWIAALTGTCAYIDVEGKLIFRWLERAEGITITPGLRYSSTVYEPVVFAGLVAEKNDETMEFGSSSNYRFYITDNSLIQGEDWIQTYLFEINAVWNKLLGTAFPYRPFEASTMPMPFLEPLDIIEYEDNDGTVFDTFITHITYTLNGSTGISAVGISETEAQCVTPSSRTPRESADMKALRNKIAVLENASEAARSRLTDMVRMALGLHLIIVTSDDGGIIYYFTTANIPDATKDYTPTLADLEGVLSSNDVIYSMSGAGLAWCLGNDWDVAAQEPKATVGWRYGIAKDGSAVLGIINTQGINVSDDDTIYRTQITPESYAVYQGANLVFGFNGQLESQINRLLVKSNINDPALENDAYIRLGSAMLIPANGGLDIVYVEDI